MRLVILKIDFAEHPEMSPVPQIGNGNWGSVWACRPKVTSQEHRFAMKLVHRMPKVTHTTKEEDQTDKEKDAIKKEIDDINSRVRSLYVVSSD